MYSRKNNGGGNISVSCGPISLRDRPKEKLAGCIDREGYGMFASILLIIVWVAIGMFGDVFLRASHGFSTWRFVAGTALYGSTSILAILTFRRQSWGWVILAWNCVSIAAGMVLSIIIFGERFTLKRAIAL